MKRGIVIHVITAPIIKIGTLKTNKINTIRITTVPVRIHECNNAFFLFCSISMLYLSWIFLYTSLKSAI